MSVSAGIHHQPSSSSSSPSAAAAAAAVGARQRHVTDHSVESLLQSASPLSAVDDCYHIGVTPRHTDMTHSLLARSLSHAATAALLPSADEALSPPACHIDKPSFHGADSDVTDCAVSVRLEHKDLWDKFNTLGTEMVITKSGR